MHAQGHFVDCGHVDRLNHGVGRHVAELRNLAAHVGGNLLLGTQHEDVGLYTHLLQLLHRVLRGLCLQFLGGTDVGHIGQMDAKRVLTKLPAQLTHAFKEWERLDVAHRTSDFGYYEIEITGVSEQLYVALYFIGNVGNYLDGLAEIVAATLLVDHALVDASCGDIVGSGSGNVGKPLVMSEVKVGLVTVDGHITLAVLIGIQCARIDVDVRVKLLNRNPEASCFKQAGKRRRNNSLTTPPVTKIYLGSTFLSYYIKLKRKVSDFNAHNNERHPSIEKPCVIFINVFYLTASVTLREPA